MLDKIGNYKDDIDEICQNKIDDGQMEKRPLVCQMGSSPNSSIHRWIFHCKPSSWW